MEDAIIVELKASSKLMAIHEALLLSQLKLCKYKLACASTSIELHLKNGIKRMANGL